MSKKSQKLTPAMKQFHHFKDKYPDSVLFFRMGDFYETFYEDAEICSRILGIALTSRDKSSNPIPLAGIPYHAVDNYLKKMLQAGYKVAVCEQVEDPQKAKGVVKRDVVRVVTPGTLTDDIMLNSKEDNYLCAVDADSGNTAAISWVDISTGHFYVQKIKEEKLLDELMRLSPSECLLPDRRGELFEAQAKKLQKQIADLTHATITQRPAWYFDPHQAENKLKKHFGTTTLEGFGISENDNCIIPAGAILEYLNETQKTTLNHITKIKLVDRKDHLQIDPTTLRSLEVLRTIRSESTKGSLLHCIDQTLTGMGGRMMRNWLCMPLSDKDTIELRQDVIEETVKSSEKLENLRECLSNIYDLERIVARISTLRASPKDLVALATTLRRVPQVKKILNTFSSELALRLSKNCNELKDLADVMEAAIEPEPPSILKDGGVIKDGFNEELDELRSVSRDGQTWLKNYQSLQIKETGIEKLKIGFNKVFGYYIEVGHAHSDKVPQNFVRKQTLKNAERYITEELKEFENKALDAREKALELEVTIFDQLRKHAADYIEDLQNLAHNLAYCDCLMSFAYLAKRRNYVRPEINTGKKLIISEGKHPVLAETLGSEFVANDVELGTGSDDLCIITGPNMSGKSTYIRQTALLVLLAQAGSFIPAEKAEIGLVDRIFTRVGASDELVKGMSTFMVEMTETANIVNNATEKSLVILDEVGRGTSTYDGLSLAWAITEHLATEIKCRTLFATHYHELTELAELFETVKNCNVSVREWMDDIVFLHKILPGGTDKSYGVHVAKLAGIPDNIIDRSKEILLELENTFAKEATGKNLSKKKTTKQQTDLLFVQKNKSILDKLNSTDVNNLTPIEAINLLNKIKDEISEN